MAEARKPFDPWSLPNIAAWVVVFAMGLQPEYTFYLLRNVSNVVTQNAFTNSYYLITYAFTVYLVWFAYRACRAADLPVDEAQGKALQIGLIGLLAFLPMRLEQAIYYHQIALPLDRYLNVATGLAKCLAWLYLFSLVLRFYTWEGPDAFARIRGLFPSARHVDDPPADEQSEVEVPAVQTPASAPGSGDLAPEEEPVTVAAPRGYSSTVD